MTLGFDRVAASAYRAYAASTNNKNFLGKEMPKFEDLPRSIQVAWEAASRHVCYLVLNQIQEEISDFELAEIEKVYIGWTPGD